MEWYFIVALFTFALCLAVSMTAGAAKKLIDGPEIVVGLIIGAAVVGLFWPITAVCCVAYAAYSSGSEL